MEKAILEAYITYASNPHLAGYPLAYEYPISGIPPMTTHIYTPGVGPVRIAGKGAPERIVQVCQLPERLAHTVLQQADLLADRGYRVLAVAGSDWPDLPFPASQDDFDWSFKGLIALENPPKGNAKAVIGQFEQAGIRVKMITGDSPQTAIAIARQVGLDNADRILTGAQVMGLDDNTLLAKVREVNVFARMFPEAKLKVIRALKAAGEVVAMTGDGVNDGPALKAAHIGVAMGRRGTEVAKAAASLVLVHDDLGGMVKAIAHGRRIYQNLKKAVAYIIAIHIPIILTVVIPLLLSWKFINLFNPVHIIFLELVMGPTCSIAFENEPGDRNLMRRPPRPLTDTFLNRKELSFSIAKGLVIAFVVLAVYWLSMQGGYSIKVVRTLTFVTLVMSNIALTLVSRSDQDSMLTTLRRRNSLLWVMILLTLALLAASLLLPSVQRFAQLAPLPGTLLQQAMLAASLSVSWIEGYKAWKRRTNQPAD